MFLTEYEHGSTNHGRKEARKDLEKNFQKVSCAGEVLREAVALPGWNKPEEKHLKTVKPKAE